MWVIANSMDRPCRLRKPSGDTRREAKLIYSSLVRPKDAPMTAFLDDNFLLSNDISQRLYHHYAATQPILDYHCHLPVQDIAENRRFRNLHEIWLEGDHYKWRGLARDGNAGRIFKGGFLPFHEIFSLAGHLSL